MVSRVGVLGLQGDYGAHAEVLEELRDGYSTALILNPVMTGIQLLRAILRELGLNDRGNDRIRSDQHGRGGLATG